MKKQWLVMNIGCIECSVDSKIVGVFSDEGEADKVAENIDKTHYWRQFGQNHFEVFLLPEPEIIDEEYLRPPIK